MYLSYGTRSNIVFVLEQLSRHILDPKVEHLCTTK